MLSRRVDVFFYGLFMDQDVLRAKGLAPETLELASVPGFALRIGQRAALVPEVSSRVHGVVMSLTLAELDRLYSEPSVEALPTLTHRARSRVCREAAGGRSEGRTTG